MVDKLKLKLDMVQQELNLFKIKQVEKGITLPHQTSTLVPSTTSFIASQISSLMGVFVGKPNIIQEPVTLEISSTLGEERRTSDHQSDLQSFLSHQNISTTSTTTTTSTLNNTRLAILENQSKLKYEELHRSTANVQDSTRSLNSQSQTSQKRSNIHLKKNRANKRRKTLQKGSDNPENLTGLKK